MEDLAIEVQPSTPKEHPQHRMQSPAVSRCQNISTWTAMASARSHQRDGVRQR